MSTGIERKPHTARDLRCAQAPAQSLAETIVDCGVYTDGVRLPGTYTPAQALASVTERGEGFVWLGLHEPTEAHMSEIGALFDLHPLATEDVVHAHQRPKVERYDDTLFLVLKTVQFVPHTSIAQAREIVETGEMMIFAAPQFVVTVRHGDFSGLTGLRHELHNDCPRLRLGPFAVLHAIADHVVDHYLEVTGNLVADIESVEEEVFARHVTRIDPLYLLKREIREFRRAVTPLGAALHRIVDEHHDLFSKEVRRRLRDVTDHHSRVAEQIASYDEIVTSLVHAASARIVVQQNTDLRKISAIVAILAVPTAIAGIYGMNFETMPELTQPWGYPAVLVLMLGVCGILFVAFRRKKWL